MGHLLPALGYPLGLLALCILKSTAFFEHRTNSEENSNVLGFCHGAPAESPQILLKLSCTYKVLMLAMIIFLQLQKSFS